MTCEEHKNQMFDYLTGALDAAEQESLRRHLASGCPACAGALAEAQATLASLPLALEPVAPSPAAKKRLMDRIGAMAKLRQTDPLPDDADRIPDSPALRLFRIFVPAAVAAGLAIIITHAVLTHNLKNQDLRTRALESILTGRDNQIRSLLGQLANQKQIVEMLRGPDLKMVQLDGGKAQPNAVARVIWDQKNDQWLLLAAGMTPPPPNKLYELWYITADQRKVPAGTFTVDAQGNGTLMTKIPPNLGPIAVAAVTDEPSLVEQPTGSVQLSAKVQ